MSVRFRQGVNQVVGNIDVDATKAKPCHDAYFVYCAGAIAYSDGELDLAGIVPIVLKKKKGC